MQNIALGFVKVAIRSRRRLGLQRRTYICFSPHCGHELKLSNHVVERARASAHTQAELEDLKRHFTLDNERVAQKCGLPLNIIFILGEFFFALINGAMPPYCECVFF